MEDTSRDREEEEERLPEEEQPSRKKIKYNILPKKYYDENNEYNETIFKDIDKMLSSDYYKKSTRNIDSRRKEVIEIRRFALSYISYIPAKFNYSTTSSDVFKEVKLERDSKNRTSTIIYIRYKGRIAFRFETAKDYIGDRAHVVDNEVYKQLKKDLEREVEEFKKDTYAGQVTERLEQSEPLNLRFVDRTIEREEPRGYRPLAYQPSYRDVDDAQKEVIERMKVDFEKQKVELEKKLREEESRRARSEDEKQRVIKHNKEVVLHFQKQIDEKENRIKVLEDQLKNKNFSQYEIDSKNREIAELEADVSRLKNEKADLEYRVKYLEKDLEKEITSRQEKELF